MLGRSVRVYYQFFKRLRQMVILSPGILGRSDLMRLESVHGKEILINFTNRLHGPFKELFLFQRLCEQKSAQIIHSCVDGKRMFSLSEWPVDLLCHTVFKGIFYGKFVVGDVGDVSDEATTQC